MELSDYDKEHWDIYTEKDKKDLAEGLALADAAPRLRIGDIAAYAAPAPEQGRA